MSASMVFAFVLVIILSTSSFTYGGDEHDKPSAYEELEEYDFPIGLIPKGVTGYEFDRETGRFKAYLNGSCSFSLENSYKLRYKSAITGVLSKDRLRDLNGVSVKILFFWINIVEVVRDGDELQFSVGLASASFPIDNFEEQPQCGCGLACKQLSTAVPTYSEKTNVV